MICGCGGSKSRLAKAAGAEPAGHRTWKSARRCGQKHISKSKGTKHLSFGPLLEVEMSKKCTPLWREAHFQVKKYKTPQLRTTFGSFNVEKVHAVVARSTFPSQKVQNTHARTTFGSWDVKKVHAVVARSTFRSQNVERTRFGPLLEVEMSKKCTRLWREEDFEVKCRKHTIVGPLLEVSMSKKCTPLWREAHFHVKMYKHTIVGPLLEVEMLKKCTPMWREAHFEVKMFKAHQLWTTFGSWDVEKVHAVVARSTFPRQNVQSTQFSDHFWKLRCRKSARRCGAKHIHMFAPLLEVPMLEKCTLLWREAHVQVKMHKTPHVRATFGGSDVEKVRAAVARNTFPSQNV